MSKEERISYEDLLPCDCANHDSDTHDDCPDCGGTGFKLELKTLTINYHEDCDPEMVKMLGEAMVEPIKIETKEITLRSHE